MEFDSNGDLGKRKNRSPESRVKEGGWCQVALEKEARLLRPDFSLPRFFTLPLPSRRLLIRSFFTNWMTGLEIIVVKNILTQVVVWGKVEGFWMNNHSINDTAPWEEEHEKMLRRHIGGAFGRVYLLTPWSDWHLIKFSLQYYPWIKDDSHENRGNDHQLRSFWFFNKFFFSVS